jgi:hypothetical protein
MYLTAGDSWQKDKKKRVVCLMKSENSLDMQLWKIEPAQKI